MRFGRWLFSSLLAFAFAPGPVFAAKVSAIAPTRKGRVHPADDLHVHVPERPAPSARPSLGTIETELRAELIASHAESHPIGHFTIPGTQIAGTVFVTTHPQDETHRVATTIIYVGVNDAGRAVLQTPHVRVMFHIGPQRDWTKASWSEGRVGEPVEIGGRFYAAIRYATKDLRAWGGSPTGAGLWAEIISTNTGGPPASLHAINLDGVGERNFDVNVPPPPR